jgi:peptidoglycan/LPS O-acetylase OafA/YrhL
MEQMKKGAQKERIIELDFLRGIAVFMILATHYPVLPFFSRFFVALDFFFVLSGFLVAGLLIRDVREKGKADVVRFLLRRGLKIYPSFYFYLFTTVLLTLLVRSFGIPLFDIEITWKTILAELFYVQNYFQGIWPHDWSLGLEEQFYFLLALLFFALRRTANSIKAIALVSLFIMAAVVYLRYIYIVKLGGTELHPITMAHLRIDAIFAGVICSCAYHLYKERFHRVQPGYWIAAIFAGGAIAIGSAQLLLFSPVSHIYAYNVFYAGSALLVTGLYMMGVSGYRPWIRYFREQAWVKALSYIGRNSYNIYLWHIFVLSSVFAIFHVTADANIWSPLAWRYLIIYSVLSIVLGIAMARLIEIPVLMWRDRKIP